MFGDLPVLSFACLSVLLVWLVPFLRGGCARSLVSPLRPSHFRRFFVFFLSPGMRGMCSSAACRYVCVPTWHVGSHGTRLSPVPSPLPRAQTMAREDPGAQDVGVRAAASSSPPLSLLEPPAPARRAVVGRAPRRTSKKTRRHLEAALESISLGGRGKRGNRRRREPRPPPLVTAARPPG